MKKIEMHPHDVFRFYAASLPPFDESGAFHRSGRFYGPAVQSGKDNDSPSTLIHRGFEADMKNGILQMIILNSDEHPRHQFFLH